MTRKRMTQIFPFLLPFRKWQKKKMFYLRMRLDGRRYAKKRQETVEGMELPYTIFETSSLMVNENSGFDMAYQLNKVHNLKLAAKTLNHIVIAPQETFSFWQLVRHADDNERYKDGLTLVNGKIVGAYGGGLCQLSNMLFWLFLHTPMEIVERHGHAAEHFPPTTTDLPCGTDATVSEGWADLKAYNGTDNTFGIEVSFDEHFMYGRIMAKMPVDTQYEVYNSDVSYVRRDGKIYQMATVCRLETEKEIRDDEGSDGGKDERKRHTLGKRAGNREDETGIGQESRREEQKEYRMRIRRELYRNRCEIGYELPEGVALASEA